MINIFSLEQIFQSKSGTETVLLTDKHRVVGDADNDETMEQKDVC